MKQLLAGTLAAGIFGNSLVLAQEPGTSKTRAAEPPTVMIYVPPLPSQWKFFVHVDGETVFYDSSSLVKRGDTLSVWWAFTFDDQKLIAGGVIIKSFKQRLEINCSNFSLAKYEILGFNEILLRGTAVAHNDQDGTFKPTDERSVGGRFVRDICSGKLS